MLINVSGYIKLENIENREMKTINHKYKTVIAATLLALGGCSEDGVSSREVLEFNTAPQVTSSPQIAVEAQANFSFTFTASDVDADDAFTISVGELPVWMSFDAETNTLSGNPGTAQIGDHSVSVMVSDGALTSTQTFKIKVTLPQEAGAWNLVWSDEFDGDSLNADNWNIETGDGSQYGITGWGNNELEWYQAENIMVESGSLKITAKEESSNGYNYTSGRMRSDGKVDVKYGRIEARIKTPEGQGLWSAFWMLPTDSQYGGWASGGELDIMEVVSPVGSENQRVSGTIHYGMAWPLNKSAGGAHELNVTDDFHVYAIEWEQDEIRWYVDDVHFATVTSDTWWSYYYENNTEGYVSQPQAPFDQDFHVLLNLAVGGNWPGSPDDATVFPATLEVDYVRVYECSVDSETGQGCVNNVSSAVTAAGTDSVYTASYDLYIDGAETLSWQVGDETAERATQIGVAWDNSGAISLMETDIGGEHGTVVEVTTSNMGNIAINAVDGGVFNLLGMGNSNEPWKLHAGELKFDMFIDSAVTPGDSMITIKMDSGWPKLGYKSFVAGDLPQDEWFSLSVPVNDLVATSGDQPLNTSAVLNIFVAEFSAAAHVMFDNISLMCGHKDQGSCGINAPEVELEGEQIIVYDDAVNEEIWSTGLGAWDTVTGADYFDGATANHVTWAEVDSDDAERGKVVEVSFGTGSADGLIYVKAAQPVNFSDFADGALVFDVKVLDYADTTGGISFKIDCLHPCSTGDQVLGVVGDGVWETITVPVADLVNAGLNLNAVNTGLVIYPTWGDQKGVTFRFDNVRWEKEMATNGGTEEPSVGGGVLIYGDAPDSNWSLWDCCGGAVYSEVAEDGRGNVAQFSFNNTATVSGTKAFEAHDASELTNGTIEFDLKVVTQPTDTSGEWLLKVEGVSNQVFAEMPLSESVEGVAPQTGEWQHYTFNISDLEADGLSPSAINIIMIFPTWGTADGAVYQLDNLVIKGN